MATKTPNLELVELQLADLNAAPAFNESLYKLDSIVQLSVISRVATAPSPSDAQGARYIVPDTGATGLFANKGKKVAYLGPQGWLFFTPRHGWLALVEAEELYYSFGSDAAWHSTGITSGDSGGIPVFTELANGLVPAPLDIEGKILFDDAVWRSLILNRLADVLISGAADRQILLFDHASGLWTNSGLALDDLSDVDVSAAVAGQVLTYTGTGWDAEDPSGGGGGGGGNVTPDDHPSSPDPVDDEFEGITLDTTGGRFSGAVPWTIRVQGTNTIDLKNGSLLLNTNTSGPVWTIITQPVPSGTWKIRCKSVITQAGSGSHIIGMIVHNSVNDKFTQFGPWIGSNDLAVFNQTGPFSGTSFGSSSFAADVPGGAKAVAGTWYYLEISNDGTNINFGYSLSGVEGSFVPVFSVAIGSFWATGFDRIGLYNNTSSVGVFGQTAIFDWLRRIS